MANEYLLNIAASLQGEADKIRALAIADDDTGERESLITRDWTELIDIELAIFKWVSLGLTSKEIAQLKGISIRTVDNHRYSLQAKIRAKNTSHAVALLYQAKLLR